MEKAQKNNREIKVYNLDLCPVEAQEIGPEIPSIDFIVKEVKNRKVLVENNISDK